MKSSKFAAAAAAAGLSLACAVVQADGGKGREGPGRFEVTITNLTRTQSFTPILAAAHSRRVAFFELGQPASEGLALLAQPERRNNLEKARELLAVMLRIATPGEHEIVVRPKSKKSVAVMDLRQVRLIPVKP